MKSYFQQLFEELSENGTAGVALADRFEDRITAALPVAALLAFRR